MNVRPLIALICKRFFGDFTAFVDLVVDQIPSPAEAAAQKVRTNYAGNAESPLAAEIRKCDKNVSRATTSPLRRPLCRASSTCTRPKIIQHSTRPRFTFLAAFLAARCTSATRSSCSAKTIPSRQVQTKLYLSDCARKPLALELRPCCPYHIRSPLVGRRGLSRVARRPPVDLRGALSNRSGANSSGHVGDD